MTRDAQWESSPLPRRVKCNPGGRSLRRRGSSRNRLRPSKTIGVPVSALGSESVIPVVTTPADGGGYSPTSRATTGGGSELQIDQEGGGSRHLEFTPARVLKALRRRWLGAGTVGIMLAG